jgi:hypothetical protein
MKARALMMLLLMVFLPSMWIFREMNSQAPQTASFLGQRRMPYNAELRAEAYAQRLERCDLHHACLPWAVLTEEVESGLGRTRTDQVVKPFSQGLF